MKTVLCLLSLLAALPIVTQAGVVISTDAGDSPLVITGWLDEAAGFTGNLRLTAQRDPPGDANAGDVSFLWLASDLKSEDGNWIVGRQHIALVGNPILQPAIPKDFQVTVMGITEPGTYRGTLDLLPSGAARAEALVIDLQVIARVRPSLKPLASAEKLEVDLVNCQTSLSCGLADLVLPESAFLNIWNLQFENPKAVETKLVKSAVVVLGEKTRFQLSSDELALSQDTQIFPAREVSTLPVMLNRTAMPPDHYTGTLYLMLEGANDMLTIPVDINIRTGPLWPLVAILAGIILGRLVKYMQERGGPQADRLVEVNRVELRLRSAPDEDRKILEPQLAAVRRKVYQYNFDTVTAELNAIEGRLETLSKLREMENDLQDETESEEKATALKKIAEVRRRVANEQHVSDLVAEIKQALEELDRGLIAKGLPDLQVRRAVRAADEAQFAADQARTPLKSAPSEHKWLRRFRDTLFALSGLSEELRAEATLWIVRPLLYFVLLFGLVAVGLNTLYVSAGLTFGAMPFADYLGLILWGLSADVAGRTLSNLQGTKSLSK